MTSDDHNDFDFQDDGDRDGDYEDAKEWIIFMFNHQGPHLSLEWSQVQPWEGNACGLP